MNDSTVFLFRDNLENPLIVSIVLFIVSFGLELWDLALAFLIMISIFMVGDVIARRLKDIRRAIENSDNLQKLN